jgi:putative transposase
MKSVLGDPIWESRAIARAAIFDYIAMWYNRKRRHSTLGNLSPEQFEWLLPIAA